MARWSGALVTLGVFMVILVIYFFFQMGYATPLGLDASIDDSLIAVFPGLFVTIIGLVAITRLNTPLIIGAFGAVGIGLAVLMNEMYDAAIVTDIMLGGTTIAQIQTLVIILSLLMGGVAYNSRR
jgi:hypothetical protein